MAVYRLGFVMEQTLGHVTHDRNLRQWVSCDGEILPTWMPIDFDARGACQRLPKVRDNWTLRASLLARSAASAACKTGSLDGLFFHTQVTSLLSVHLMSRVRSVVSLDATPINVDTVGAAYGHAPSRSGVFEKFKNRLNKRSFQSARHLITWCDWARDSLIRDYGVPERKVTVIPPGVDLGRWQFDRFASQGAGLTRLLFVGGDFRRKGGELLLDVFMKSLADKCELHIVTRDPVETLGLKNVCVHRGLTSNAPELLELFAQADVFVFPTLGDCLPIAVMEAMAAELPVVATRVGALSEEVVDGTTGFLIEPGDREALADRVLNLARDADLRRQMGWAGRRRAEQKFNGATNYRAVLQLYKRCVDGQR